jgi:hypothetical protein
MSAKQQYEKLMNLTKEQEKEAGRMSDLFKDIDFDVPVIWTAMGNMIVATVDEVFDTESEAGEFLERFYDHIRDMASDIFDDEKSPDRLQLKNPN